MLVLPKKTSHPLHTDSILEINRVTSRAEDYTGIHNINRVTQSESLSSAEAAPFTVSRASETPMSSRVSNPSPSYRRSAQQNTFTSSAPSGISHQIMPALINQTRKGQKTLLGDAISLGKIKACLGWNVKNPACDVDVSAFLLGRDGKVSGDDWFVFYGQKESPDCSVIFSDRENTDRESVAIDLSRLNPSVYVDSSNYSYRLDGSNVDIDTEEVKLASEQIRYQGITAGINGQFDRMRSVIK